MSRFVKNPLLDEPRGQEPVDLLVIVGLLVFVAYWAG